MTTSSLISDMTITSIGIDYLTACAQANQKGYFSGFRLGSTNGVNIVSSSTNVSGSVTYIGSTSEMNYSRVNKYETIIRATLDHTRGDFDVGSFAFLVGPSYIPFFIGKFQYIHKKAASTSTKLGDRLTFQVKFKMYMVDTYWSFGNIVQNYVQADDSETNIADIPDTPVESPGYLITIDTPMSVDQRKGYLLYPGRHGLSWRAPDIQMKHTSTKFWGIYGGFDSDGHNYTN